MNCLNAYPDQPDRPQSFTFSAQALDVLMPMHLLVSGTGHITRVGPTMAKIFQGQPVVGRRFLELFEMRRPRGAKSVDDLQKANETNIYLALRSNQRTTLKGTLIDPKNGKGMLINLSLGISVIDAVDHFGLTNADFAPTDLAIEMLYLVEAKAAVMNETRNLNSRLESAKMAAEEQAFTDTLTGLKNRRALDVIFHKLQNSDEKFAVMQLDLDYFKSVNDTLGHAAGDYVLQQVADALIAVTRANDSLVRIGGDEFVLIINGITDTEVLAAIGKRIIKRLEEPIEFEGELAKISGSIGVSTSAMYQQSDLSQMMSDADQALYQSKEGGRGQVSFWDAKTARAKTKTPKDATARG